MSGASPDPGAPIVRGSPLARRLDEFAVPSLPADFEARVLGAAAARSDALPELRRPRSSLRRWRIGQRIAIGIASFGIVATAAAATGLLERFDIPVPSAQKVWASMTSKPEAPAAVPAASQQAAAASPAPAALAPVAITGRIDTPEELSEAFRRIDAVRDKRFATRQARIDQSIDAAIERRRAAGLRVPTAEQQARLRERIAAGEARRKQQRDQQVTLRREDMARRVESGEALTRQDVVQPLRRDAQAPLQEQRLRDLRQMSPAERREALRRLPPAERRALAEAFRARRASGAAPDTATAAPETPAE